LGGRGGNRVVSGRPQVVRCPAKINLVLRVLGRRPDGYHELDTVFQAIDLWDRVSIEPADALTLECDDPRLPVDGRNLVLRAARLLRESHGDRFHAGRIVLRKAIPVEAGLGGGSSDAAGVLVACNRFWSLGLDRAALAELGARLGADVPFFLTGGTARGRGRGDRIEALPFLGERWVVLGCPPFGISTAEVFRRVSSRLTASGIGVSVPHLSALKWPEDKDLGPLGNDLEPVVYEGWPELRGFRDAVLESGSDAALLSGSGSAVFGVFSESATARRAADGLSSRFAGWCVLATRFVREGVRTESPPDAAEGPGGEA